MSIYLLLFSSIFILGCSSEQLQNPDAVGQIGAPCTDSSGCEDGPCLTDKSFPGGYCYKDCEKAPDSCPKGSTCESYLDFQWCMDSCEGDDDCRKDEDYACEYGVCRPPCDNNRPCRGDDTCRGGHCEPPCTKDEECPDGRCQDGECLPPCKSPDECLPDQTCDTASGRCVDKPGKKMGAACGSSNECATGYCLPTRKICSIKCDGAADCPKSYACGLEKLDADGNGSFDGAEADCVPVAGDGRTGDTCTKDEECASSHCYNGFCLEGCHSTENCSDATCTEVRLLVGGAIAKYYGCLPKQGVTHNFPLGTFKYGELVGLDIPDGAVSMVINSEVASTTESGFVTLLTDPQGESVIDLSQFLDVCAYFSQPNRYRPAAQVSTLMVPNSPEVTLRSGLYTFYVGSTSEIPVTVTLSLKLGNATQGTLDLNYFFANLAGNACVPGGTLNAASAPSHSWFKKLRGDVTKLLGLAKMTIGNETYNDINNPALDIITVDMDGSGASELDTLFATSKGQSGPSINVFFVRELQSPGSYGGPLGVAGGLPGPPALHGKIHSGVVLSMQMACYEQAYGYNTGHAMVHEMGHYLGLSHNIEQPTYPGLDQKTNEVLCDCPCGANLMCQYDFGAKWCRGLDNLPDTKDSHTNLMYWAAESDQQFVGAQLTSQQIDVMRRNPLTGH